MRALQLGKYYSSVTTCNAGACIHPVTVLGYARRKKIVTKIVGGGGEQVLYKWKITSFDGHKQPEADTVRGVLGSPVPYRLCR